MSESTRQQTGFDGWKLVVGSRSSEFRKYVRDEVVRTCRGEGPIGALGLQVKRRVQ
jgi:hypothetical protein